MIPRIYDSERVVRILGDDEEVSHATINKPLAAPEMDEKTGAIRTVLNDLTVGTYDVTVLQVPATRRSAKRPQTRWFRSARHGQNLWTLPAIRSSRR